MLSSITKKGDIESTSAPWVVLVINVNISLVGLTLLPSMFQISATSFSTALVFPEEQGMMRQVA